MRTNYKKEVDFVKSSFDRTTGGTVTEVAVKPVLNLLYPNMYKFLEPISGMIASKKSILEKLVLEKRLWCRYWNFIRCNKSRIYSKRSKYRRN